MGRGFFSGITGIITNPIKEVKKEGAIGIFKGFAKGMSGLVTKPIGGILDALSVTAEGLKETVTFFDEKSNIKKFRYPRVFYGKKRYFLVYKYDDYLI